MGDAGSMLIGFTVIWLLLLSSQEGSSPPLRPVTALWLIAVPLMDMAAVMIRRIRRGQSPFKPDREHLHHICQHVGLNSSQTLVFICMVASAFSIIGMIGECLEVSESLMFYSFLVCFAGYIYAINNIWRITSFFRKSLSDKEQVKNSNEDLASINK